MVKDAEVVLGDYVWGRYDLLGIFDTISSLMSRLNFKI